MRYRGEVLESRVSQFGIRVQELGSMASVVRDGMVWGQGAGFGWVGATRS